MYFVVFLFFSFPVTQNALYMKIMEGYGKTGSSVTWSLFWERWVDFSENGTGFDRRRGSQQGCDCVCSMFAGKKQIVQWLCQNLW